MSRGATLSILGLWQWDNTILDSMVLPAGVNKDILFPDLLAECAEFEILYPEPDTFKTVLLSWSNHRTPIWERIYNLAQLEYNPIENYDRIEEWTDTGSGSENNSQTQSGTNTKNETNTQTLNQTQKNYQGGYNPNIVGNPPEMVQQEEQQTNGTTTTNDNISATNNGNMSGNTTTSGTSSHSGRVHGNIGVTTTQQMMEQEINIAEKIDVYAYIIRDFKTRFCIPLF